MRLRGRRLASRAGQARLTDAFRVGAPSCSPAFDESPDPWVAINQARLWRLLDREVQVAIELRRVPVRLTEPLLERARGELCGR